MAKRQNGGTRRKKGNRKHDRNRAKCVRYRDEGRKERNALRRLRRHIHSHPADVSARNCYGSAVSR